VYRTQQLEDRSMIRKVLAPLVVALAATFVMASTSDAAPAQKKTVRHRAKSIHSASSQTSGTTAKKPATRKRTAARPTTSASAKSRTTTRKPATARRPATKPH
jgi:hypothetical protein